MGDIMKKSKITILTIVVIILGIYTCIIGINSQGVQNPIAGEELALSATGIDGNELDNGIFKDRKMTMVYIWSASDKECIDSIDDIVTISNEYSDEINVVGLVAETNVDDAKKSILENQITFENFLLDKDSNDFIFNYFYDIPLILFIDKDGIVLEPFIEVMVDYDYIKYIIDEEIVK